MSGQILPWNCADAVLECSAGYCVCLVVPLGVDLLQCMLVFAAVRCAQLHTAYTVVPATACYLETSAAC